MSTEERIAGIVTRARRDAEDDKLPESLDLRVLVRIFRFTRPYRKTVVFLSVIIVLRSLQLPALAWAIGAVINGPITTGDARGTALGAVGFLVLSLFTQLTMHYRSRLALELGEAVMHDMRNAIFEHLHTLNMAFFQRTRLGRIISRITSDLEAVRNGVQNVLFVSMVQFGQMIGAGVLMLVYDWVLFSVVLAMAPVIWVINRHFTRRLTHANRAMQESFSRVTATLAESVGGIRLTQGYVRQEVNAGFFRRLVEDHSKYTLGAARMTGVFLPLLEMNSQFFISALLLLGGYRVLNPEIATPVGDLIQFFFLANLFFEPVRVIGTQYTNAIAAVAGAERVFRLLDTKPDWTDRPGAKKLDRPAGRVEFDRLWFEYNPGEPVLKDIVFTAMPGQSVALVGHTGSGKSSIINLITKFYLPTRGTLRIDGHDILDLESSSLHRHMGIVQQVNFLFTGTVMDNIRLARPGATDAEVVDVVRRLGCTDVIESLPDGFRTQVGERGGSLSLGQRQIVCFARAMLADPRILILDEATSSIDTLTEAMAQAALKILLLGRTSFIVAHRLSTIIHADLVLVLDQGRIVERGTHQELLAQRGTYARLYRDFIRATAG